MYAGSLIVPFDRLARAYEAEHPGVKVYTESHGSIQVMRHVSELGDLVDVAVTADAQLIPPMLYETRDPDTGEPYATWSLRFATNRMVLAYTDRSRDADRIDARSWPGIIASPDVRFGLADPRFDAAGYRALMVLQLAESVYDDPIIFEDVLMGRFREPITATSSGGESVISVPEILEPEADAGIVLRGASIQLVALLESGDLDYAFEYESVARQHGLRYVRLPAELDLATPRCGDLYRSVVVDIDLQRFESVTPRFRGDLITYALTIPTTAPEPDLAADFIAFVYGSEGRRILAEASQPLIDPPLADRPQAMPETLRALADPDGGPGAASPQGP